MENVDWPGVVRVLKVVKVKLDISIQSQDKAKKKQS